MNSEKYCFSCGRPIPLDSAICPYCGAKQSIFVQTEPEPNNNNNTNIKIQNYILWSWICAIVALFIPLIAVISVVLGALVQKSKRDTGTILIAVGVTTGLLGLAIWS